MKSLTFAEFFAMPPGTIFGQATGLPHQFSTGLFAKGESYPEDDGECRAVAAIDTLPMDGGGESGVAWFIYEGETEDDHRFLVYEPDDLDRLARLIGRGPEQAARPTIRHYTGQPGGWTTSVWRDPADDLWRYEATRREYCGVFTCTGTAHSEQAAWDAMAAEIERYRDKGDDARTAELVGRPCRAEGPEGPAAAHGADGGAITWERYNQ